MRKPVNILAIDDEEPMLRIIRKTLEPEGYTVRAYDRAPEALKSLREHETDLIVTDLMMPEAGGFKIINEALSLDKEIIVIVITAFSSIETAVEAMKLGAYDFIPKPFDPEHLLFVVKKGLERRSLKFENIGLKSQLTSRDYLGEIIGNSKPILYVKNLIMKVSETEGNVMLIGESGVGKELVAKAIHYGSMRSENPFLPINCGALPDSLLESELFGYERGAFTGAQARKIGLLELAHGGTVFLDEVAGISQMMQVKLLRFLQDRSFIRLGGKEVTNVDVRIVSATNEDLSDHIRDGSFRKDLYYRLNVIPIEIPPLRERLDDIPLLVKHITEKFAAKMGRKIEGVTKEAELLLMHYCWEGNVRELENALERAITLTDGSWINPSDLPHEIQAFKAGARPESSPYPFDISLRELEKIHIRNVLERSGGNKSEAARILGIDYSTLLRKLK